MSPSLAPVSISTDLGTANARNNILGIRIKPDCEAFAAVLAQERYEWALKLRVILFLGISVAGAMLAFFHPIVAAFGFLVVPLLTRLPPFLRFMELRGHAIEAAAAVTYYGADIDGYEYEEGKSMFWGYDGIFKGLGSPDEVAAELKKHREFGAEWVRRRAKMIRRDMVRAQDWSPVK